MKKLFILPPRSNSRLISTLMSSRNSDSNTSKSFVLKSTSEFASRSGDVFGKLQTLEKHHEEWVSDNKTIEPFEEPNNLDVVEDSESFKKPLPRHLQQAKKYLGKPKNRDQDLLFKRPFPMQQQKRKASPEFKMQPQKWTKYSLEDTPISSDATNTAVALQFINEIRMRKEENPDNNENTEKILFNKPIQKESRANTGINTFESFSLNSTKPSTKIQTVPNENQLESQNIKLSHLQDDGDD